MKKSKEELDRTRAFLDDAIKLGVKMNLEKEANESILTAKDLDKMNIPQPPADMYEQIMKQIYSNKKKNTKKFRIRKVCLIAAIISILFVSALSVQAVRMYIYNIGVQIVEGGVNLFGVHGGKSEIFEVEDEESFVQAEITLGHRFGERLC
jgi:hypothetical protein